MFKVCTVCSILIGLGSKEYALTRNVEWSFLKIPTNDDPTLELHTYPQPNPAECVPIDDGYGIWFIAE